MEQYLNDNDVPDNDDDYEDEDENFIPLEDITYSLTNRGGTQMIINEREIFRQSKCSRNRDGLYYVSWNCKDNTCPGRLNSHRQNVDEGDINVNITKGNNFNVFFIRFQV
jgi:hypothetical protein